MKYGQKNVCKLVLSVSIVFGLVFGFLASPGWAKEPWEGKLTYSKTPAGTPGPELAYDSYAAVAIQSPMIGSRNKEDVKKNLDNVCRLIDDVMFIGGGAGVKLVALTEGALQGMADEQFDIDQATYCRDVAITIPGPEVDRLIKKAKQWKIYLAVQAKVKEPDFMPDRYFNTGFIISPEGEIILRHVKNTVHSIEGSTTPYDVWDVWAEKVGTELENFYPVVKTEIGNLAVAICWETVFPETYRALSLLGAEVIFSPAIPSLAVYDGTWQALRRVRAMDNACYVIAPNLGPYYTNSDAQETYELGGGHSIIADYQGRTVAEATTGNAGYVVGEIDIKNLRDYRASGAGKGVYVRSGLWKQIYERWPDYGKNLYLEESIPKAQARVKMKKDIAEKFIDAGIYAAP
jgi:predicted amidohydrolase